MQKKKTALGNAARTKVLDGFGVPSSGVRIPRWWHRVKSSGGKQWKLGAELNQELGR